MKTQYQLRLLIEKEFGKDLRRYAWLITREELESGNRRQAIKYWFDLLRYNPRQLRNVKLMARVLLPAYVYKALKQFADRLKGGR